MAAQHDERLALCRIQAHQHLTAEADRFLADPAREHEFADPAIPRYLRHLLHKEGLVAANRAVRDAISHLKSGVPTAPFWDLVDATGFWEDATPGRWPHMTASGAQRSLDWALAYRAGQPFLVADEAVAA